mmetsp:Transcript_51811/g.60536  ORF Transcript_51811/g.60536 Transcript_51811/m.60536 type:complete len:466 (-) Transcript_51811:335-1732(-)
MPQAPGFFDAAPRNLKKWIQLPPDELLERAPEILRNLEVNSPLFSTHVARSFPKFTLEEIELGNLLGEGGFSKVFEIRFSKSGAQDETSDQEEPRQTSSHDEALRNDFDVDNDDHINAKSETAQDEFDEIETKKNMALYAVRNGNQARYAIKKLRPDLSETNRAKGIMDLAIEAKFLSVLWHPNIVKMRAFADSSSVLPGFFLILDRLYGTLDDKIDEWEEDYAKIKGSRWFRRADNKVEMQIHWVDKLLVAYDMACAMRYLHEQSIVYRDIKPENIGFDVRGDLKLFDFGLAKELKPTDLKNDGTYRHTTARTGSLVYMAPEVALAQLYNFKADCYSFGILLWEIFSLKRPFNQFLLREIYDKVVIKGYRPKVRSSWPGAATSIIKECWDKNISKRPDFTRICQILRSELSTAAAEDDPDIINRTSHMMDRSSHSMSGRKEKRNSGLNDSCHDSYHGGHQQGEK